MKNSHLIIDPIRGSVSVGCSFLVPSISAVLFSSDCSSLPAEKIIGFNKNILTNIKLRECLFQSFYYDKGRHRKKSAVRLKKKLCQTLMILKETKRPSVPFLLPSQCLRVWRLFSGYFIYQSHKAAVGPYKIYWGTFLYTPFKSLWGAEIHGLIDCCCCCCFWWTFGLQRLFSFIKVTLLERINLFIHSFIHLVFICSSPLGSLKYWTVQWYIL